MAQLTTEQLLLLNNLMYMNDDSCFHKITGYSQDGQPDTIADIINSIDMNKLDSWKGNHVTSDEWKKMINAIKQDEQLMNVQLISTHVDNSEGGGGGVSALFADPSTNEAIVVYKGTEGAKEWVDNFNGGNVASTPHQENALDWYRSLPLDSYDTITVSGHSKGGNKAKFVTIMDNSIDRCVSFDGQGFSDKFMEQYANEIARNQDKIQNHVIDYDFVNPLLNDIGSMHYYDANDLDSFAENHAPNTFFDYDEDGNCVMHETSRPEEIAALDDFMNSALRSMSEEEREKTLNMLEEIVTTVNSSDFAAQDIIDIFMATDNREAAAYLIAYLIAYERENPGFGEDLQNLLSEYDLEQVAQYIPMIQDILDAWWFDKVLEIAGDGINHLPDWLLEKLSELAESYGIPLSPEELRRLLSVVSLVSDDLESIDDIPDGSDKKVTSVTANGRVAFAVDIARMSEAAESLSEISRQLESLSSQITDLGHQMSGSLNIVGYLTRRQGEKVMNWSSKCSSLMSVLQTLSEEYRVSEKNCATL